MKRSILNQLIRSTLIASALLVGQAQAQVPVTDGTAAPMLAAQRFAQDVIQWGKEYLNWKAQYDALMSGNIQGLLGELGVTGEKAVKAEAGSDYGQAAEDAYMKNSAAACGSSSNGGYYNACISARRMRAQTLMEMNSIMKGVNARSAEINRLLEQGSGSLLPGQMQALQYKMAGLQAMLQNDISRLQVTLAIHKQKVEMYEQQMREERSRSFYGNGEAIAVKF